MSDDFEKAAVDLLSQAGNSLAGLEEAIRSATPHVWEALVAFTFVKGVGHAIIEFLTILAILALSGFLISVGNQYKTDSGIVTDDTFIVWGFGGIMVFVALFLGAATFVDSLIMVFAPEAHVIAHLVAKLG